MVRSWARKESDLQFMADAKQIPAGDPPPLNLIEEALVNRQEFAAIELQTQLLYALVDQVTLSIALLMLSSTTYILNHCILVPYSMRLGLI